MTSLLCRYYSIFWSLPLASGKGFCQWSLFLCLFKFTTSLRHDSCSAACIRGVAHHSLPKSFKLGGEIYRKQKSPTSFFFGLFLFQGRFLTSYGSKAHGGEICLLFLCLTLWGATPYNSLYKGAPPKRVTFFRCQVYERVRISLFEVMKG